MGRPDSILGQFG